MKKDSNNWKKYGFSFWVAFSVVAITLGLLGAIFAGFSAYTFVLGKGGLFWVALFVFGLISLACACFCFRLLPDWANMIRSFRLLDQRFKGAMGATSVSQYLQADEERNRVLMESIEAKQNAVGHNLAERINKLQVENEANARKTNTNITQMEQTMKAFMAKLDRFTSPLELQQHRDEVEKLNEKMKQFAMPDFQNMVKDEPKEVFKIPEEIVSEPEFVNEPEVRELKEPVKQTPKAVKAEEDEDIEVPEPPKDSGTGFMF
jgi:hypothetical protein